MITEYNTDQGTFILPLKEDDLDYNTFERLNQQLGSGVLLEISHCTENFTQFDIDYSLIGYENLKDAKAELKAVYSYVRDYLDITNEVDADAWKSENTQYREDSRKQNIELYESCLAETLEKGPNHTYVGLFYCKVASAMKKQVKKSFKTPEIYNHRVAELQQELKELKETA